MGVIKNENTIWTSNKSDLETHIEECDLIEQINKNHLIALQKYKAGERYLVSTHVGELLSVGYGKLSDLGFWEFPLFEAWSEEDEINWKEIVNKEIIERKI